MRASVIFALLAVVPATAAADQLTADAVEAMIVHLDQEDAASHARTESQWGVDLPDDTVFVLRRESLAERAGLSLGEIEELMSALHQRRVPARWCQARCPIRGGDQRISLGLVLAISSDRLLVETEVFGRGRPAPWFPGGCSAWSHDGSFLLEEERGQWRVVGYKTGTISDMMASRCP